MTQSVKSKGVKYALISEAMYKNLQNANKLTDQTESAEFKQIKSLDDKIAEILNNKTLPDSIKAKLYSLTLQQYYNLRQKAPETAITTEPVIQEDQDSQTIPLSPVAPVILPPLLPMKRRGEEEEEIGPSPKRKRKAEKTPERSKKSEIVSRSIPSRNIDALQLINYPNVRKRAEAILSALRGKQDIVSFNPTTGTVMIRGHLMKGADIRNILKYVSSPTIRSSAPEGTPQFLEALGHAGVNPNLIENEEMREIVKGALGKGFRRKRVKWFKIY